AFIEKVCSPSRLRHADTVVVIGLRADFYAQALRHPALVASLQDAQVVVGPMNREEIRRAILEPARKANIDVEEGLVELLLSDLAPVAGHLGAAHDAGALPLLSHALLATWERGQGRSLTVGGYSDIGGI